MIHKFMMKHFTMKLIMMKNNNLGSWVGRVEFLSPRVLLEHFCFVFKI